MDVVQGYSSSPAGTSECSHDDTDDKIEENEEDSALFLGIAKTVGESPKRLKRRLVKISDTKLLDTHQWFFQPFTFMYTYIYHLSFFFLFFFPSQAFI